MNISLEEYTDLLKKYEELRREKIKILNKYYVEKDDLKQEIERLNNIINELEDLIVIKLQRDYHEHNYRINTGDLEEIYDKLQELKGSDKE